MFNKSLLVLAMSLMQVGCGTEPDRVLTSAEAVTISNEHFGKVLPQVPLSDLRIEVEDKGETWRVNYYPPEGSTGDGPLPVDVSKRDKKVTRGLQ
jgi:hypothetical protein